MIYYCLRTDCPRNHTITSTRIDVQTRMPVIVNICTCEGRAKQGGCCLRCKMRADD